MIVFFCRLLVNSVSRENILSGQHRLVRRNRSPVFGGRFRSISCGVYGQCRYKLSV